MGVSVEVWRARIGSFNAGRITPSSSAIYDASHWGLSVMTLLLINTLLLISCIEANPGPAPLQATCVQCGVTLHSVSNYGRHQAVHLRDKNFTFPCLVCDHNFSSESAFFTHYSRFHKEADKNQVQGGGSQTREQPIRIQAADVFSDVLLGVDYKCSQITCQHSCRTVKELKQHMESHIKNGYVIACPFEECDNKFSKISTFRIHMSQYHKGQDISQAEDEPVITYHINEEGCIGFSDDVEDEGVGCEENESDEDDDDDDEFFFANETHGQADRDQHDDIYPENMVRDSVGKFYLWLEGVLLIPAVKVQLISQQIALLAEMSHHRIRVALKAELLKAGIAEEKAKQIADSTLKKDTIYATHHKGMDVVNLTTDHMRNLFYTQRCAFLEPEQVPLGLNDAGKKKFAHYIPVKDTLQIMFNDPTVQQQLEDSFNRQGTPGTYRDFTDGSAFTDHPVCGLMKSIQLVFFQDAFEFYPLSPTAGAYKCVGFYFVLGNLHPNSRSKVDAIQLAFIVKESDLKFFGPDVVLSKLIDELKDLAVNGIQYKGENLPVVVTNVCGDNLGQHFIGGFLESFNSEYFCRFCEISKKTIEKNPSCTLPLRTPHDYDEVIAEIDPEDPLDHKKGIKGRSVLNEIPFFHVSNPSLPPCIGHDILEGIARMDYALYLRYFIQVKGWITFDTLNRRIQHFKCKGRDSADSLVKLEPSLKKIRGHASEVWLFVRMFPFLIADSIEDEEDEVWQLALQLKTICEYVFAPKLTDNMIVKLKVMTHLYVENRAKLFNKKLQPKHHYVVHYADLIAIFGPLIRLWTLRFESRHVFFKQAAKAANNFKNITHTLAKKYVLNFAYKFTGHMFPPAVSFREKDVSRVVINDMKPDVVQLLRADASFNRILKSVDVHGITYSPGLWVMLGSKGQDLVVGEILLIVYNGKSLKFILRSHLAEDSHRGFYQILKEEAFTWTLQENLEDYYPLPCYEYQGHQCLSLKHANPSMAMS